MDRTTVSVDDGLVRRAQDAGLNVSQLTREAIVEALQRPTYHLFNTNADHLPGDATGAGVYGHGVVATFADAGDPDAVAEYGGHVGEVEAGDRLFSWENDSGLRAAGVALEDGDADPVAPEHRLFHPASGDTHEFHAPVRWVAVLDRADALAPDEVRRVVGHPAWARGAHAVLDDDQFPDLLWDAVVGRARG